MQTRYVHSFVAASLVAIVLALLPAASARSQPVWEPTGGPEGGAITALLVTPDQTILAATNIGGVLSSDDKGETWTRRDVTGIFETISDFAVNSRGHLFGASSRGLRRSTDGGETWGLNWEGLTSEFTRSIAVNADDVIFLGSTNTGIMRSGDNGDTWTEVNNGLTGMSIRALTTGPGGELYAATNDGVFESTDNGESWTDISNGLPDRGTLSIFVDGRGVLWTSTGILYRKIDAGTDWEFVHSAYVNVVDTISTGAMIAGASGSILISENDGDSWEKISPIPGAFIFVQDVVEINGSILAASNPHGVLRSDDDGQTWQTVNDGVDVTDVTSLVASEHLFAGTRQGVFRSDDLGDTWVLNNDGLTAPNIETLFMTSTGTLLAGTNNDGVFSSLDDAATWAKAQPATLSGIFSFAEAPNGDLFAGGWTEILLSTDGSATWDTVDTGFGSQVEALAVSPAGVVFAGANSGIRRSTDGGETWEDINNGVPEHPDVTDFLFLPNGDALATAFRGVLRSGDGGDSWAFTGQIPHAGLKDIARDSDGTLYITSRGGGVAISSNDGATWTTIDEGLNNLNATVVAVMTADPGDGSDSDRVFVATRGGGVSRLVTVATSIETENPGADDALLAGPNYPNPFNDVSRIPVELQKPSNVTLTVFDILGREVRAYEVGLLPAGTALLVVDAADLTPGAYVYRVDVSGIQKTGLMTISK